MISKKSQNAVAISNKRIVKLALVNSIIIASLMQEVIILLILFTYYIEEINIAGVIII